MTAAPANTVAANWEIRSDLPGRIRLRCDGLEHSSALRRHCQMVLTACHWLEGFRINPLASCLSLRFPADQRAAVERLLELALTLPPGFNALQEFSPAHQRRSKTLRHAALCGGLLGLDWVVGLPLVAMQGAAALLMVPVLIELIRTVQRMRSLPVQALDLGFSAVLIQLGLPREALTDLALDDGSELLQEASHGEMKPADYRSLLERIAEQISVRMASAPGHRRAIGTLVAGDRIVLQTNDPVFVPCRLVGGSLLVIHRQLTGDWHPKQMHEGDPLELGSLVLSGEAQVEVVQAFADCPLFQLPAKQHDEAKERPFKRSQAFLNPLLFGLGSYWALSGASERALAAFQFNPITDWETSRTANTLAAVAELRLHGIQIANPDALIKLGRMQRLLVSQSCVERLAPLELQEELHANSGLKRGELVRILAGLQQHLVHEQGVPIWNGQLENVANPIEVQHCTLHELSQEGWELSLHDGRKLTVVSNPRHKAAGQNDASVVEPLEFRLGKRCLGWVNLQRASNDRWLQARRELEQLGITVSVVGDAVPDLEESQRRLRCVEEHQSQGELVGYLGNLMVDIPALARADLAMGLDFDEAGVFTSKLCDAALSRDPAWLPRLVVLSRSLQRTADGNAVLIGLTHVLASVATAGLAISPLQTVLLADIPVLLAELRNLNSFQSHTRSVKRG